MLSADGFTAHEIAEMLLEQTGNGLLSGDFDSFALCFHVPHVIETPDQKTILKTRSALRTVFDRVRQDHADRNVTDLIRICEVAEFRGPFKIESTHITHMMSGNLRVLEPFPSFSVVEYIDDRWQATSTQYAVDQNTTVGLALRGGLAETNTPAQAPSAAGTSKKEN